MDIYKGALRAHFGDNGTTWFNGSRYQQLLNSNTTLKDALLKPMKIRSLVPEMCVAYVYHGITKTPLLWETRVSKIKNNDIYVEQTGFWPIKLSHQIQKKNFLSLDICSICNKRLIGGFYCTNCNLTFHENCSKNIPILCEQLKVPTNVIERLEPGIRSNFKSLNSLSSTEYMSLLESQVGPNDLVNISIPADTPIKISKPVQYQNTQDIENYESLDSICLFREREPHFINVNEEWEIPLKEILVNRHPIGSGAFGKVYKGHWYGSVAVKVLKNNDPTTNQIWDFKNEIELLKKTRHDNILLFMGCVREGNQLLALVTQWCEGSSLYRHIHVMESEFKVIDIINIAKQISQGMNYLHGKNIIHRDLKSNNVFLYDEKSFVIKIGDFGLATVKQNMNGSRSVYHPEGSILWMAPEVIKSKTTFASSFKSDIYSFGIVLYELLAKRLPYTEGGCNGVKENGERSQLDPMQIIWLVGSGRLIPSMKEIRKDIPRSIRSLMMKCIKYSAKERPLFSHVLDMLNEIISTLPRMSRTLSEPILNLLISLQTNTIVT